MNEDTTIIIPTKNNQKTIIETTKTLCEYMTKYRNIKQIIITDNASTDETLPKLINELNQLKDEKILLITQPTKTEEKKTLTIALEQTQTPITIIIEPELNTRLHQLQRQIKKLRKADLILPNRQHKESKTKWTNKKEETKNNKHNRLIKKILGIKYEDTTNTNKAFKTKKILEALQRTTSTNHYWQEIIKHENIKITETRTHWIQETNQTTNFSIIKTIKELIKILRKK